MANGDMQKMGMMARGDMPMPESTNAFEQKVESLSPESKNTLEQHLTPPLKKVMGELFGTEVASALQEIGPDQPTINIPVSIVAQAYPAQSIEESVQMMGQDLAMRGQKDIPASPQGGMGGEPMMDSPQTNVPPRAMPTGMV
tara:strand:+ start:219 stop:644 length:426 start_codon:yes stop_codon:yes gene_type:complete